jgi:hypothetical protein
MKEINAIAKLCAVAWILLSTGAYAGEAVPGVPTRESVIELLEITNSYNLSLQIMEQSMNSLLSGINEGLPNNKKIPVEVWANLINETKIEINQESYYDMIIPIYRKYLTADDVKGIVAFYMSESGKKLTKVLPDIAREGGQAGEEWGRKAMYRIIPRLQKRLREMGYTNEPIG